MGQKASGHGCADRPAGAAMPLYHAPVRLLTDGCLFGPRVIQDGPGTSAENPGCPGTSEENRPEMRGNPFLIPNSLLTTDNEFVIIGV